MNFSQFQQQLQQTLAFTEQLAKQFPDGNLPALDKDVLTARLRSLYELLTFNQPSNLFVQTSTPTVLVETIAETVEQPTALVETIAETVEKPTVLVETIAETVEQPTVLVETIAETVEQPTVLVETIAEESTSNEVEFVIEQPHTRLKPEVNTPLEIINTENISQDNSLAIVQTPKEEPKTEVTGLTVNSGFSMVEQKITINNRAIYDANEEALRNQSSFKSEYDELFEFKAASELSQRLSETKVEDLNKAMGLNEKFFYINELFGGNSAKFRACLEFLNNNAKNIESAREYLEADIMDTHSWANPKRKPLAKDFIKTVRRRYLK